MPAISERKESFSAPEVARRLGVNTSKIGEWIRSGELPAINVAKTVNGHRPRYRITREALEEFELRRAVVPPSPSPSRRRARQADADVIEFFWDTRLALVAPTGEKDWYEKRPAHAKAAKHAWDRAMEIREMQSNDHAPPSPQPLSPSTRPRLRATSFCRFADGANDAVYHLQDEIEQRGLGWDDPLHLAASRLQIYARILDAIGLGAVSPSELGEIANGLRLPRRA